MPISGVVITLADDLHQRQRALEALAHRPEITLGPCDNRRAAAVLDTGDLDNNRDVWMWLHQLEGVTHVDIVTINFEDEPGVNGASENSQFEG